MNQPMTTRALRRAYHWRRVIQSVVARGGAGRGCDGCCAAGIARLALFVLVQSCFAARKEGYRYNETGAILSIKCVCMSFSSIISVVFTFTRANVSILTFFVFNFF